MVPTDLFSPCGLGLYRLYNRLVITPVTRLCCDRDDVPGDMVAEYCAQRASMGLIVTGGTFPDLAAYIWPGQPGIKTTGQAAGWRKVADAVHARDGIIVMQTMHAGRLSHPTINGTSRVVSASDTAAPGHAHNLSGRVDYIPAEPLARPGIERVVESWARAAHNAVDAGMDSVQIHGADGYLIHQFLAFNTNMRNDGWNDDPHRKVHLAVEVTRAVAVEVGGQRTSIRLPPGHDIQGIEETDPADVEATYQHLTRGITPLGLGFVNILHTAPDSKLVQGIHHTVGAPLVVNRGFGAVTSREEVASLVADGVAEVVGVGRPALVDPDLVGCQRTGIPENTPVQETIYGGGASGYTDHPTLQGRETLRWSWLSRPAILLPRTG